MSGGNGGPDDDRGQLVHRFLEDAAARWPDAAAVRDESGSWTYRELLSASQRVASWLRHRGVRQGDRLLVALPNSRRLVAVIHGALRAGVAVVPVSAQARPYHLAAVARDARPGLALGGDPERFAAAVAALPGLEVIDPDQAAREWAVLTPRDDPAGVSGSDLALLVYTSGSTAGPKGVVCPHRQVAFAVEAIAGRLGYLSEDIVYARLPFSFDYSLYQMFLCAQAGAQLALASAADEISAFRWLRTFRPTVLPVVPPYAQTLLGLAGRSESGVRPRLITNTGAALTRGVADSLRSTFPGVAVVPMYGMTECKRITIAAPDEDLTKPGTVGTALPGTRVEVVGEDGAPLPPGRVGEIVVRGPHVMAGYWQQPAASAERFGSDPATGERILRTGDFGTLDEQGAVAFVGRRDDIFKRRGVRTSVGEIEAAALDIPEVEEAAAALVGAARECVLWVRSRLRQEQILKGIADRLEPAKVPDRCVLVDELPRTSSGKIDKKRLGEGMVTG
ncbi:class I adenylate-forming enzyme family protein [Plantactinospora sp. WMMC1484]|uniref:class I adenylate-forming enzyme family protein n=1 Tax=Plantactinospora sp. WMMC1484 TaxID=3404122 RepID=UPI003BF5274D